MIIHYHHIPPLWEKMNNFVFAYSGTYFYNALSWWNETCVNSMLTTILFFWYWYLDHRYRVHVFEFEFKKWVLNYSLSILQFHFIKLRQYLGILRVSLKMANTRCTGDHPKHVFGDDVARNHSLSYEEESCRLDGETLCLLQNFCAISDKAEQCLNTA